MPRLLTPELAAARLRKLSRLRPTLAVVLGSGFQHVLNGLEVVQKIPCAKLPGWPATTVAGHKGELVLVRVNRRPVLFLSGRAHFYEGHEMPRVVFAVRALAAFGIRDLLLTNAAGGINRRFHGPGRSP